MKINFLKVIAYVFIMLLPVSLLITLTSEKMTSDQMNLSVIVSVLFCMAGLIILKSSTTSNSTMDKKKAMKRFWIAVLSLNVVIFFILMMPGLEVYCGLKMPFVHIDSQTFTVFGHTEKDPNKQLGIMLLTGVLMMLPGRIICLALQKISRG